VQPTSYGVTEKCGLRREVQRYIDEHESDIIQFLQSMIRARSVNLTLSSGFWLGTEAYAAELIIPELKAIGFEVKVFELEEGRPNIVARLRGKVGKPRLLINSHLDTVPVDNIDLPKWRFNPFSGELAEGSIWGRGACDHKSMGASIIWAAKALRELGIELEGDLVVVQDSDEEAGGFKGFNYLAEKHREEIEADFAIYAVNTQVTNENMENFPSFSSYNIWVRTMATKTFKIRIWEDPPHPENLINPKAAGRLSELCMRFIHWIWKLAEEMASRHDPLLGHDILTLDGVEFHRKKAWSTTPGSCEITVTCRYSPEHIDPSEEISRVLDEFKAIENVKAEIELVSYRPGMSMPTDSEVVEAIKRAAVEVRGVEPKTTGTPVGISWGFTNLVNTLGIPTACFGYGCVDRHHSINERISVEDLKDTTKVFALVYMDLLKAYDRP
jgi:acetylornithine deacetylase/succinyl-diaminopimelate desuccinylase-like protein